MNNAVISECGNYRYWLERTIENPVGDKVFGFFGINPSTADASLDDATVRKWKGFALRNECSRFIVGNLFAYRSTDPAVLKGVSDPLGPERDYYLNKIISEVDIIVPCWGRINKIPKNLKWVVDDMMNLLQESGKPVLCFGKTACGQPKHPLMLGYDTPLESYGILDCFLV